MEQCGDDEDFLRELLSDLRGEIDAQIVKIDEVLEVREVYARFFCVEDDLRCVQMMPWHGRGVDGGGLGVCLFRPVSGMCYFYVRVCGSNML